MAYIRDYKVTEVAATAATWIAEMPTHASGDLLVAVWGKDSTTGLAPTGTTGGGTGTWTEYEDVSSTAANGGIHLCRATASDAVYSGTLTAETGVVVVAAIADVYGSTLADCITHSEVAASDATAIPFAGASGFSTSYDGQLILDCFFSDGGTSPTAYAPSTNLYAGDVTNGSLCVAYRYIKTAGSIPQVNFFGRGNDDGRFMMLAIRPAASTDAKSCYSDPAVSVGQVLRPFVGVSTMQSGTWPTTSPPAVPCIGSEWEIVYNDNNGVFTNVTTAVNDLTTADYTPTDATTTNIYFGHSATFRSIALQLSTAGTVGTYVAEYYNGSTWATLTLKNGNVSTLLTTQKMMAFNPPTNWATTAINGTTKYWVRLRCSVVHTADPVISIGRRDGNPTAYIVATASGDNGTNPYTDGAANAGESSRDNLTGFQWTFGAALDMDTGIIYGTYRGALGRDLGVDIAKPNESSPVGGIGFSLFDTNNYSKSYIVGGRTGKDTRVSDRNVFAVDWNGAATAWASYNTINKSAVTTSHWHTQGKYGAAAVVWSMLVLASKLGVAGGNATTQRTIDEIVTMANTSCGIFPFLQKSGSAVEVWIPLQFGGSDTVGVNCQGVVFQYPTRYDGINYFRWNAANDVAGTTFYAQSGDYLDFKGAQWISPDTARWEWNSSTASSGWTGDFRNTVLKGQTVTLRAAFDVADSDNMTFEDCTIDQNGATLANQTYIDSPIACDSPAHAALISNGAFTSSGTGHAITITGTAANFTFTGNTFTGYAASDGSTGNEAIYVNIGSGTMTISISGGSTPSIRTAGATVTVVNSKTLTFTGLVTGSDIVLTTSDTNTVILSVDAHGSTSYGYSYNYVAGTYIDIKIIKAGYVVYPVYDYLLTNADASLPIAQVIDRAYI